MLSDAEVAVTGIDTYFREEPISDVVFARMQGKSWKDDCPLQRSELKYLKMLHRNADGHPQLGEMVVNAAIADKVLEIFRQLYEKDYRIERMVLIDDFDADDTKAMRANNTSCFNFRYMSGSTTRLSKHAQGLAIDINPLYNPYVRQRADGSWRIEPVEGEPYALHRDQRTDIPYKIDRNDFVYRLFIAAGFRWGGSWSRVKDYQHFEIDL